MRKVFSLIIFLFGIFLFSYFVGATGFLKILAFVGILLSTILIVIECSSIAELQQKFLLVKSKRIYVLLGILTGIAVGGIYRNSLGISFIPKSFSIFVFVAAAIGASEELIFRGYVQRKLSEFNSWGAVVGGALSHTIYKVLLFVNPFVVQSIDIWFLLSWTFAVGIVFGILTKFSKSIWPALLAHMIFDVLVYGQLLSAPWWLW